MDADAIWPGKNIAVPGDMGLTAIAAANFVHQGTIPILTLVQEAFIVLTGWSGCMKGKPYQVVRPVIQPYIAVIVMPHAPAGMMAII